MENLTAAEKRILNDLSQVRDPEVKLGDKIQTLIDVMNEKKPVRQSTKVK